MNISSFDARKSIALDLVLSENCRIAENRPEDRIAWSVVKFLSFA